MKALTECEHCHGPLDNTMVPKIAMAGVPGGYQIVFLHKQCEIAWNKTHAGR